MKTFNNISRNECLEVFPKIYLSANRKWKSAVTIAKKEDYASSTFLMISSIEEYLKALILALDGNGFRFRNIKGLDGMFKNHSLRYPVIYLFHLMASSFEFSESIKKEKGLIRKALFSIKKYTEASSNLKWYASLDQLREKSLYSNFDNEVLQLPDSIGEEEYFKIQNNLIKVRYSFYSVLFILDPKARRCQEERNQFIETLKTMTNNLGLYDSLEEQLELIRENGYNSNHLRTIIDIFNKVS